MNTFIKKHLDELAGGDAFSSGGDRNVTNNSEIETGPIQKPFNDKSEYEKGEPTTTDKVTSRYRQDIPWFAVYSFGAKRPGIPLNEKQNNSTIIKKKNVEEKIEDLVKKSKSSDLTDKNYNPKLAKIIDNINDVDLTPEQIEDLCKAIEAKKQEANKPKKL